MDKSDRIEIEVREMKYCIYNVRIISGKKEQPYEQGTVLFDESGIIDVTETSITDKGDINIDGSGLSILPGLIDAHVHLGMDCSPDPFKKIATDREADTAFIAYDQGQKFLKAGITTVRNLGTKNNVDIAYRDAVKNGTVLGPRVYAAGQPIAMTGGHGYPMAIEADGVDEIRKASRKQIKIGADLLKLMATGGVLTKGNDPGAPQLSIDELKAACKEASHASKTTAAHAIGLEGVKNAIKAGVTTIEHGYYLDDEAVEMMVKNGTYLVPTLLAPTLILKHSEVIPKHMIKKIEIIEQEHRQSFRRALKKGVKVAVGTDAGTPFNYPGLIVDEMELMVTEGMSPLEVIHAATYVGAECLRIEKKVGTIEKGKWADLILVEGNPLEDVSTLKKIRQVFKEGKPCL